LSKKIDEDTWVNCPECKTKLKKENLPAHMKRVHKKKMDDAKVKSLETPHKKQGNKTPRGIPKTTIAIITIIFVVVVASIGIYFLSYSNDSNVQNNSENPNDQNDNKSNSVSIDGKGNYSSIQEAIDSASENDIIFVSNGTYSENIKIKKSIELIGEDKNTTIINGNGSGTVIYVLADYVTIRGFTIKNRGSNTENEADAGIEIRSNYSTISDCNISSNKSYGLYLLGIPKTTNNIIKFNTISNNSDGIYASNAKLNNISSNTFAYNTEYGIYLGSRSDNNLVSDNIFTENNYAIRVKGSTINTVVKNLIMNNDNGLYFCCGAINNSAYNNVFINNTNWNANDVPGNTWDNGTVGNYWDDYTGTDANGDGIGDTPYLISGDNRDRFPLMQEI
jgi:nitrous oxidase accessory protein